MTFPTIRMTIYARNVDTTRAEVTCADQYSLNAKLKMESDGQMQLYTQNIDIRHVRIKISAIRICNMYNDHKIIK